MIGASKILTVSYGTFSCTLEGFDEPFSTMKAIAEYFRDLAAEDRYFGAVPPTPDAEMLHRIAEREIQRRVEAKISENGIVLRQAAEPAAAPSIVPAAPPAEPVAAPDVDRPVIAKAPAPVAPPVAPQAPLPAQPPVAATAPTTIPASDDTSIAAKLARIRAAVSASTAAVAVSAMPASFEDAGNEDDEADSLFLDAETGPSQDFSFDIELPDIGHLDVGHTNAGHATGDAEPAIDFEAQVDAVPADQAGVEPETETETASTADVEPEADEISQMPESGVAEPETTEAGTADAAAHDGSTEADWSAALSAALAQSDVETADVEAESATEDDADTDDLIARFAHADDAMEPEAADAPEAIADVAAEPAMPDTEAPDLAQADLVPADMALTDWEDADTAVTLASDTVAEAADFADEADMEDDADHDLADLAALDGVHDAEAAVMQDDGDVDLSGIIDDAERDAAMISDTIADDADQTTHKISADDYDDDYEDEADMFGEGRSDDVAFEDDEPAGIVSEAAALKDAAAAAIPTAPVTAAPARPGLLSRARARVIKVRKTLEGTAEDEAIMPAADASAGNERRAILESNAPDNDEGVSRLMDEAANKLEGAENRRRFSAISHLKAAVAATVADRKLKPQDVPAAPAADTDDLSPYRDDLSKAVRPRRPVAETSSAPTTRRPAVEQRPAPLVLVSEQRVDTPDDFASTDYTIRPRRISSSTMVLADDDSEAEEEIDMPLSPEDVANFAEFADRLGATSLPELLEAAAAYTATVEGQPHFSRPQILRRVAHVTDEGDFTREDGLRSFGMLLRQGKIQKVRRGQFELSETSRFKSEARRVAQ